MTEILQFCSNRTSVKIKPGRRNQVLPEAAILPAYLAIDSIYQFHMKHTIPVDVRDDVLSGLEETRLRFLHCVCKSFQPEMF